MASWWLIAALILGVGEIITTSFFLFWFAIGALVALLVALIPGSTFLVQFTVFTIVSILLLICTKPFVKRFVQKDDKQISNYMANVGKKALVTQKISIADSTGQIKLNGETWSAIPETLSDTYEAGTEVTIVKIEGVKAVVKA